MDLAQMVYASTEEFPKREIYGLAAQMRRAGCSIPSNIAEGSNRATRKDYRHFIAVARGSNNELQTQIELALRIGLLSQPVAVAMQDKAAEVGRMLYRLWVYLAPKRTV